MIGQGRVLETLRGLLGKSRSDQAEALFWGIDEGLTRFAGNVIHQNVAVKDANVYLRAVRGRKIGVAVTNRFDPETLAAALARAEQIADSQREFEHSVTLPSPSPASEVPTFFESTASMGPEDRARTVRQVLDASVSAGVTAAGSLSTGTTELAVANSLGVEAYQTFTGAATNMVLSREDSSGFASWAGRDAGNLDILALIETAKRKCLEGKSPVEVEPGDFTVVLEEEAVANLLEWINYIGFSATSFREKTSFMADRIGERIFGENITIADDGLDPGGLAMPFDFEGVAKRRMVLVDRGKAAAVAHNTLSGIRAGKPSTGHALPPDESLDEALPMNLVVEPGESDREKMISSVSRGILVTRFHYINGYLDTRNALLTGMTRDGTFLIEDGRVTKGLKNLRFTQNMLEAFSDVKAISKDRKTSPSWWGQLGAIRAPAMLIGRFRFTGKTG